jgi:glycosyltransferase involved in cell wall biosynthesis
VPVYPFQLNWSKEELFPNIKFDIVVARYLYGVGLMKLWNVAPRLYVDIDDYPMQVVETMYAPKYGFLRRVVSRVINKLFCKYVIGKLTGCWIANSEQVQLIKAKCTCRALLNIPFMNGIKELTVDSEREDVRNNEQYVFTVGLMSYPPNYLGIDAFLDSIWSSVNARFPRLRYKIVGKGIPEDYKRKWSKIENVELLGYVEDISQLYRNCTATIVPITSGGGTCIKTLESMAHSRICLSTSFGARGLPYESLQDGRNCVIVYDSANTFLVAIEKVMNNREWRAVREESAKEYIKANYSIENFEKTVADVVNEVY